MDFTLAETSYWIDEPIAIEEQISRWDFARGYVFRIDGDGQPVGAVFVADGTWTVQFERRSDAMVAASRLTVLEDVDPAGLSSAMDALTLTETIDRGYVLANDIWGELSPKLRPVDKRAGVLVTPASDAAEEILVVDDRSLAAARRIAETLLRERVEHLRRYAFDPGSLLVADRPQPLELRTRIAEFRTGQTWDRFAGESELGLQQRWLAYVRDPSGAFDRESRASVLAQGLIEEHLVRKAVARERFPADIDGVHRAPHRVDLVNAGVTAVWDRESSGFSLADRVVTDLTVQAVGGPASIVWIDVPHVEQQGMGAAPPLAEGWALEGVSTTEGAPLEVLHLPLTSDQREGRGNSRTFAVRLPDELPEGQTLTIRVSYRDHHRYTHQTGALAGYGKGGTTLYAQDPAGTSTDVLPLMPRVRTHAGPPAPTAVRVGVRPWYARQDKIAVSGQRGRSYVEGNYRYTESVTNSSAPIMAIGQWSEDFEPAKLGFPAIRSQLMSQGSEVHDQLPVEVRSVLNGWATMLPSYPAAEIGLAELYKSPYRIALWFAGDGMIPIQPMSLRQSGPRAPELRIRKLLPHIESFAVSTALHMHWWSATGFAPGVDDLPRILGSIYGIKMVGARFGAEAEDSWFEMYRVGASTADRRVDSYLGGAFVLGRTLTDEIGEPALYEAVDRTLSGEFPPTVDGLQAALEATSGREMGDFFDLWIRSGLSPDVTASLRQEGLEVHVDLRCDIPLASLTVPVRVVGHGVQQDIEVPIVRGTGTASLLFAGQAERVIIDPDKRLLLMRRNDAL